MALTDTNALKEGEPEADAVSEAAAVDEPTALLEMAALGVRTFDAVAFPTEPLGRLDTVPVTQVGVAVPVPPLMLLL